MMNIRKKRKLNKIFFNAAEAAHVVSKAIMVVVSKAIMAVFGYKFEYPEEVI